jgi:hypothetical protein
VTRIPYVRRENLGPEGQRLWDGIVSAWGDLAVTANGGLAGPFNANAFTVPLPPDALPMWAESCAFAPARGAARPGPPRLHHPDPPRRIDSPRGKSIRLQRQRGGHGFPWPPRERRIRAANS